MRSQLGDRIPIAMRALEISSGKTSAELEKMLEQGQLTSEYIMPMVMAMGELASANGAYEKALKKLGTVENRMKASGGLAASRIGEAGFTEGLIGLYEKLIEVFENNNQSLEELGKVFNVFFRVIKKGIDLITPPLKAVIRVFGTLARTLEYLTQNPMKAMEVGILGIGAALLMLYKKTDNIKDFGKALTAAFRGPLFILLTIVGLMDEIRAYFDADVIGLFDDPNMSKADRDKQAAERKGLWGIGPAQANEEKFTKAIREKLGGGLIGGAVAGSVDSLSYPFESFYNYMSGLIKSSYANGTSGILTNGAAGTLTVVIPVMLNGREISREVVKDANKQQAAAMASSMPAGGQ